MIIDKKIIMMEEKNEEIGVEKNEEVMDIIERVRESGIGVIMIRNKMEDVSDVEERIVVMRIG